MIGIIVSGSAVPTAARTDPTAPSARSSLRPNHSMPLVNSSAPARMTTKAMASVRTSIVRPWSRRRSPTAIAMTTRMAVDTPTISQSRSRA